MVEFLLNGRSEGKAVDMKKASGSLFGKIIAGLMIPGVAVAYLIIFGKKKKKATV